jgi:iron complex outermembrane receptor protein
VVVRGAKFNCTSVGAKIYAIDSLSSETYKSGSLAELLQQQSLIYVKTYGSGGLASVSLRGGSSRHTAVIWNGFNLRSPMSGGLNFSSLPAGFIDDVIIQPGALQPCMESGASSGIIFLSNNLPLIKEGLGINLSSPK